VFNTCRYVNMEALGLPKAANGSFAVMRDSHTGTVYQMTDEVYPTTFNAIYADKVQTGIQYQYKSKTVCPYAKDATFTFTNKVMCDAKIKKNGEATIVSSEVTNTCNPVVTMSHASGCPEYSVLGLTVWMEETWWFSGAALIVLGLGIGMAGRKLEKLIVALIGAIVTLGLTLMIGSLAEWLSTPTGIAVVVTVAIGLSALVFWILYKSVKLQFFVLGFVGGFMLGSLLYEVILSASGCHEIWIFYTTICSCCLAGGLAAYCQGEWLILFSTSFIGAYLLMRGFAFFFGGYPTESVIYFKVKAGMPLNLDWIAWCYYGSCAVFFVFNYCW